MNSFPHNKLLQGFLQGFRSGESFVDLYYHCPTKSNLWITSVGSQPGKDIRKISYSRCKERSWLQFGALRSKPTDAMEVIAGLIPLDLHTMELAARSRVRTKPLVKDSMGWNRWKPKRTWKGRWPLKILGQVHRGYRRVGEATPMGKLLDRVGGLGMGGRTNIIYRWGRK